ncbi:hypothetical protein KNU62_gp60 [Gordonia phage Bakery]|uniref:SsDNA binding protein n=1 Tax=Gordonia phage Bakery TaxID=2591205 RepID=A0A514DGW5_9CAUD|nr:hypothetical protein KNU62_gp60 [Gordonia phage Bakery]QDH92845.1 hypothetical protein SEA_BAKERY_60 [Gordonia phage Bakery]
MGNTYQPIAESARPSTEVSQATAVEQSRAVAEVQAAVLVAQQNRRIKTVAVVEMRDSTAQRSVADKAFFRFPRGGETVSGPSIHLARELARCWGNIQFGVSELRRDDVKGESEMQAYAWDLETNARNVTSFIVPHTRDTKRGVKKLTDMRDIYENNANSGARRLRECIFAVLPPWFIDEAVDRCNATLKDGGGVPLAQRITNAIELYSGIAISRDQLEAKLGRSSNDWTEHDVAQLGVIWKSIDRGEVQKDEEFAPARVSADDLPAGGTSKRTTTTAARKSTTKTKTAEENQDTGDPQPVEPSGDNTEQKYDRDNLLSALADAFTDQAITAKQEQLDWLANLVGDRVDAITDLSDEEIVNAIGVLTGNSK